MVSRHPLEMVRLPVSPRAQELEDQVGLEPTQARSRRFKRPLPLPLGSLVQLEDVVGLAPTMRRQGAHRIKSPGRSLLRSHVQNADR